MKFWEWMAFGSGTLSALSADSSVFWCVFLALVCVSSVLMAKLSGEIQTEQRKAEAIKRADFSSSETDSWTVRPCKTEPLQSDSISLWDEYQ